MFTSLTGPTTSDECRSPFARRLGKARRVCEAVVATAALVATAPLLILASVAIALSDPGPVLYRARRIGRDRRRLDRRDNSEVRVPERRRPGYNGREFTLLKLRTMRQNSGSPITASNDPRVFRVGSWLRAAKIDELPQLLNVIRGDMSLVGPRPEAPEIVRGHYKAQDLETLQVLPGLTSPGSLYYYAHCESALDTGDVTQYYAEHVLPKKLAIDRAYVEQATVFDDVVTILRTMGVIASRLLVRSSSKSPGDLEKATPGSTASDTLSNDRSGAASRGGAQLTESVHRGDV